MELDSIVDWSKAAKSVDHEATSNKQPTGHLQCFKMLCCNNAMWTKCKRFTPTFIFNEYLINSSLISIAF